MYAVIDVETTGGSPSSDRVVEIAVIVFDGDKIIDSYETLLNPGRAIDPYVTKLTGITQEMVQSAPTFQQVHQRILELTNENIFVAHNVKFDFGMLRQEFRRLGIDFNRRQIDTVNLARKALPGFESYSLGNICDSLGIDITNRHRAYGDAEATVRLFSMILSKPAAARYIEIELNHGIDMDLLPPYLSKAEIEKLPEDAGVFQKRNSWRSWKSSANTLPADLYLLRLRPVQVVGWGGLLHREPQHLTLGFVPHPNLRLTFCMAGCGSSSSPTPG